MLRPALVQAAAAALRDLERESAAGGPGLLVTLPGAIARAASCTQRGARRRGPQRVPYKRELPKYGVFDEKRVFLAGPLPSPVLSWRSPRAAVCEDIWFGEVAGTSLREAPSCARAERSPFEVEKFQSAWTWARARRRHARALVYVNQVGGQDEPYSTGLVCRQSRRRIATRLPFWRESLAITRVDARRRQTALGLHRAAGGRERLPSIYSAMVSACATT